MSREPRTFWTTLLAHCGMISWNSIWSNKLICNASDRGQCSQAVESQSLVLHLIYLLTMKDQIPNFSRSPSRARISKFDLHDVPNSVNPSNSMLPMHSGRAKMHPAWTLPLLNCDRLFTAYYQLCSFPYSRPGNALDSFNSDPVDWNGIGESTNIYTYIVTLRFHFCILLDGWFFCQSSTWRVYRTFFRLSPFRHIILARNLLAYHGGMMTRRPGFLYRRSVHLLGTT